MVLVADKTQDTQIVCVFISKEVSSETWSDLLFALCLLYGVMALAGVRQCDPQNGSNQSGHLLTCLRVFTPHCQIVITNINLLSKILTMDL